jgi:hypothetical protein
MRVYMNQARVSVNRFMTDVHGTASQGAVAQTYSPNERMPMRRSFAVLIAASAIALTPTNAAEDELVLPWGADYIIDVSINAVPFKVRVDPDIGGSRVLNAEAAKKLGLKGSMIGGLHMVGPVKLTANSNVLNYDFGGLKDKNRTFWFVERPASTKADGSVSASALPYKRVSFQLGPEPKLPPKVYTLPLSKNGNHAVLIVKGAEIAVGFNLDRAATVATASTGLLLTDAYGGGFSGPAVPTMIRYGVERPTRPIAFKQPIVIGGRSLDSLLVRVSDFGDATQIKDADAPDSDEIIVTAASKRKPYYAMALGRDFLADCSKLTFDYQLKQVQMHCKL